MLYRTLLVALGATVLVAVAPEAQGKGGFPITQCGTTVTQSAVLTQDLTCAGLSGIVVGASGITIDLAGHVLKGDYSLHYGVEDTGGYDKLTVKNGVVRNFEAGIYATGADAVSISNVVAAGNNSAGIHVEGLAPKVASSTATGNFIGFELDGAAASLKSALASGNRNSGVSMAGAKASVQATTASGNGGGIYISGAQASVKSSIASGSDAGYGIYITGNQTLVQSSTVNGNYADGIYVFGDAAKVTHNIVDGNGYADGLSDGASMGIYTNPLYTTPPTGSNVAHGNDDPQECIPALLC